MTTSRVVPGNWYRTKNGSLVQVLRVDDGNAIVLSHFTGQKVAVPCVDNACFTLAEDPGTPAGRYNQDSGSRLIRHSARTKVPRWERTRKRMAMLPEDLSIRPVKRPARPRTLSAWERTKKRMALLPEEARVRPKRALTLGRATPVSMGDVIERGHRRMRAQREKRKRK